MSALENAKGAAEQLTGLSRPRRDDLPSLIRLQPPSAFRFKDDGIIPNHPTWPLIVYRQAVRLPDEFDPAAVLEDIFVSNGWGGLWRNGIYDYAHYHSQIHEALGVARGHGQVRFGGARGRTLTLKAGDIAILPAGTGHMRLAASRDFLVVGAYPPDGKYDECASPEVHDRARSTVVKVGRPRTDPVYGADGPLLNVWT
jgi:uncharacterized protein YjlB